MDFNTKILCNFIFIEIIRYVYKNILLHYLFIILRMGKNICYLKYCFTLKKIINTNSINYSFPLYEILEKKNNKYYQSINQI